MTDAEAAWMGAIFEGEGSVVVEMYPARSGSTHLLPRIRVTVNNSDPEVLSACLRLTRAGRVTYRRAATEKGPIRSTRPQFVWAVQAINAALDFLRQVSPYSWKAQSAVTRAAALGLEGSL